MIFKVFSGISDYSRIFQMSHLFEYQRFSGFLTFSRISDCPRISQMSRFFEYQRFPGFQRTEDDGSRTIYIHEYVDAAMSLNEGMTQSEALDMYAREAAGGK